MPLSAGGGTKQTIPLPILRPAPIPAVAGKQAGINHGIWPGGRLLEQSNSWKTKDTQLASNKSKEEICSFQVEKKLFLEEGNSSISGVKINRVAHGDRTIEPIPPQKRQIYLLLCTMEIPILGYEKDLLLLLLFSPLAERGINQKTGEGEEEEETRRPSFLPSSQSNQGSTFCKNLALKSPKY